jgi:hypothetical protein
MPWKTVVGSSSCYSPWAVAVQRHGFLSAVWPFVVVEFIWSGVALRRYFNV